MKKSLFIYSLIFCIVISLISPFSTLAKELKKENKLVVNKSAIEIGGNATSTDADVAPSDAPSINAESAIVMDVDTGDVLYEKYAHEKHYPASITKVLTCLLAVENGNVNDTITVSDSVMSQVEMDSSRIGLQSGEQLTLKDALYGMMLNSGNECALAIAEYVAGSTEGFADLMNQTAKELGCTDTHFINPNGIHNEDHYTSCYDMALIGCAAYQYPEFKKLISSQSYTIPKTNKNEARDLWQENRLIYSGNGEYYYEYCTGGKTGYTETALATLISFAERDGRRLVTVVMKCNPTTESYRDTILLDDFCFNKYKLCKPLINFEFNNKNKDNEIVLSNFYEDLDHTLPIYYVNQNYSFYVRSSIDDQDIDKVIELYDKPIGNISGKIRFYNNGLELGATDILASVPNITSTSTDAIMSINNTPKPESKLVQTVKKIIIILVIGIFIMVFIIIFLDIKKTVQQYNSRRRVKYFPVSRDIRLKDKEEQSNSEADKQNHNTKKDKVDKKESDKKQEIKVQDEKE